MCGINLAFHFGAKKEEKVNDHVIDVYENQYQRGTEGFGIIRIKPDNSVEIDRACEPVKMMLDLALKGSERIMMHHRNPTSTDNKLDQTHPIVVANVELLKSNYLIMHNGVIQKPEEVRTMHEKLGFSYTTAYEEYVTAAYSREKFNDSEALAIELARFIEGQTTEIAAMGSMAFIVLECDQDWKAVKLHFGRNGNPLNMSKTRGKLYLSSEGEGNPVETMVLYSAKMDDEMKLTKRPFRVKERPAAPPYQGNPMGYGQSTYCYAQSCYRQKKSGSLYCVEHQGYSQSTSPVKSDKFALPAPAATATQATIQSSGSASEADIDRIVNGLNYDEMDIDERAGAYYELKAAEQQEEDDVPATESEIGEAIDQMRFEAEEACSEYFTDLLMNVTMVTIPDTRDRTSAIKRVFNLMKSAEDLVHQDVMQYIDLEKEEAKIEAAATEVPATPSLFPYKQDLSAPKITEGHPNIGGLAE